MTTPVEETPLEPQDAPEDQGVTPPPAEPAEPAEEHSEPDTDPADQEPDDQGADPVKTARGEAARHRREKQEALTRLATTEEALQASRRAHAESLLPDGALSVRGDLWFGGATVDQVLDETGNVSRDLVAKLANEQVQARPGLGNGTRPAHRAAGYGNGVNAYAREPGGKARTQSGWELHEAEQKGLVTWDDAAQSTRVGDLKNGEQLRRIVER